MKKAEKAPEAEGRKRKKRENILFVYMCMRKEIK